jgi:tripartite-type tricarboxylate transporter receptor subunit TctC
VARADPDGYTLLIHASSLIINPVLFAKVFYDVEKDFIPLVDIADAPTMFAASLAVGAKSHAEFADAAKRNGRFSYSHAGLGTVSHLTAEIYKKHAGFDMAAACLCT